MKNLFILLILLQLFVSCAVDIDYKIPVHRFMDPETQGTKIFNGEVDGMIQLSIQKDHKLTMTEVFDFSVFGTSVSEDQAFSHTSNVGLQLGLGLFPMMDLYYRENGDSPAMVVAKFQVFGTHAKEMAEGFKLGLWAGAGHMDENEGTLTVANNGSSRTYSGEIEVTPWELGLTLGQRFSPNFILYLNALHARYDSKSTLTSNVHPTVTVEGEAQLSALNLGLKYSVNRFALHLEFGASDVRWNEQLNLRQRIGSGAVATSFTF